MMPGMIMLWYGSIATIPSGWTLCDGTLNTPDLSDRFIKAASVSTAPGTRGGANTHVHDFTGDSHAHDLAAGTNVLNSDPVGDYHHTTSTSPATGTTDAGYSVPLYHALCYIMKLPIA